jgi:hypothetical protein
MKEKTRKGGGQQRGCLNHTITWVWSIGNLAQYNPLLCTLLVANDTCVLFVTDIELINIV